MSDNYASKEAYLLSSTAGIVLLFGAFIQPFFASSPKSGLIRLAIVVVGGGLFLRLW
jgi:hypothetical protein